MHVVFLGMLTCNSFVASLPLGDDLVEVQDGPVELRLSESIALIAGLAPDTEYTLTSFPSRNRQVFRTLKWEKSPLVPLDMRRMYISPKENGKFLPLHVSGEYLWTDSFQYEFWAQIFRHGMFCLPHGAIVLVPNPVERFCFLLDSREIRWHTNRRMKRDAFTFSVTNCSSSGMELLKKVLDEGLRVCAAMHGDGWITEEFISNISLIVENCSDLDFHVFRLIEIASGKTAAWSLGFRYRSSFMDFTACTPIRDKRSAGKILLIKESRWLKANGVKLWYLGFELPYMVGLSEDAQRLSRSEFQAKWRDPGYIICDFSSQCVSVGYVGRIKFGIGRAARAFFQQRWPD